jgi:hypothetical protein
VSPTLDPGDFNGCQLHPILQPHTHTAKHVAWTAGHGRDTALVRCCTATATAHPTPGQVLLVHSTPASPTWSFCIKSTTLASSSSGMSGRLMTEVGT